MIEIVVSSIHPWRCDLAWLFWVQVCRLLNRANWFNSFVDGISIESLARSSSSSSRLIINRLFLFRLQVAAISAPRTAFNLIRRARALLLSSASPPLYELRWLIHRRPAALLHLSSPGWWQPTSASGYYADWMDSLSEYILNSLLYIGLHSSRLCTNRDGQRCWFKQTISFLLLFF